MRCLAVVTFVAVSLTALGCSADPTSSAPDAPLQDGGDLDAEFDSGNQPEVWPDVLPDSEVGHDTGDAVDGDAGDCSGYVAASVCIVDGCFAPAGCVMMGSPPDEPGRDTLEDQVPVTFDRVFWVQQHEATLADWTAEGFAIPTAMTQDIGTCTDPDCPVTGVTWFEAIAFANKYSERQLWPKCYELDGCTGEMGEGMVCDTVTPVYDGDGYCFGYRVPTSAEWEYAARGGTTTAFYDGPNDAAPDSSTCAAEPHLDTIGWYCDNAGSPPSTHRVGEKAANPLALDDMAGNAAEWVSDSYPSEPLDPEPFLGMLAGVSADGPGQVRGGHAGAPPWECRSASRESVPKDARRSSIGFRLVQTFTSVR